MRRAAPAVAVKEAAGAEECVAVYFNSLGCSFQLLYFAIEIFYSYSRLQIMVQQCF